MLAHTMVFAIEMGEKLGYKTTNQIMSDHSKSFFFLGTMANKSEQEIQYFDKCID